MIARNRPPRASGRPDRRIDGEQRAKSLTASKFGHSLKAVARSEDTALLREHGINPSAQRVAVADYVLHTGDHPSADEVLTRVRRRFPHISRATVYNTLNLFVEVGLLRQLVLNEGRVVFDPKTEDHHHFIEDGTGEIQDVPWDAVEVSRVAELEGLDVREYQVVMRGRKSPRKSQ
jgi:Fur family iron response transcriptional regulator